MKTKRYTDWLWLVVLVLFASCGQDKDFRSCIPADVKAVMALDVHSWVVKGGMHEPATREIWQGCLQSWMSEDDFSFVRDFLEDPTETGIAWDQPVYAFRTCNDETALLVKVESRSDVKSFLSKIGKRYTSWKVEADDAFNFVDTDEYSIVFNKEALIVLFNEQGKTKDNIRLKASAWLEQDPSDSFISHKDFAAFDKEGGDVTAWVSLDVVPDMYKEAVQLGMPRDINLADWHYLAVLKFEQGKILTDIRMHSASEAAEQLYEQQAEVFHPIQGKFLPDVAAEPWLWLGLSADGEALYKEVIANANLLHLLEGVTFGFDIRKFISTVQGDFALGVPSPEEADIVIQAQMKNDSVLYDMEQLIQVMTLLGVDVQKDGTKGYCMRADSASLAWVGVDEAHNFYYTPSKEWLKPAQDFPTWVDEARGSLCYMHVDLTKIATEWSAPLQPCRTLVFKLDDAKHSTLEIRMERNDENSLCQLVDSWLQMYGKN